MSNTFQSQREKNQATLDSLRDWASLVNENHPEAWDIVKAATTLPPPPPGIESKIDYFRARLPAELQADFDLLITNIADFFRLAAEGED